MLQVAADVGGVGAARAAAVVGVCRRPEAEVWRAVPVGAVVARFVAGERVVGDFVLAITGGCERVGEVAEHFEVDVVVGFADGAVVAEACQRRPFLIHQGVGGDVLRTQCHGFGYRLTPLLHGLFRKREDKVKAYVAERLQRLHYAACRRGIVPTANGAQQRVVEALHPYAETVEAEAAPSDGFIFGDVVGVYLDGAFCGALPYRAAGGECLYEG